jgi:hypothetical protein
MPLARYLSFVGGALLALLFVLDAFLPELPAAAKAKVYPPLIRIHSDEKWPERIVYDTSLETIVPVVAASEPTTIAPEKVAEAASGTKVREAFAMLPPSVEGSLVLHARTQILKPRHHRKSTRKHAAAPMIAMARNQQFGWFGRNGW